MTNSINFEINESLFKDKLNQFIFFVNAENNETTFTEFQKNKYINSQERYKDKIRNKANEELEGAKNIKTFGSGNILNCVLRSIEIEGNNLLKWHDRYGPGSKVQQCLYNLKNDEERLQIGRAHV